MNKYKVGDLLSTGSSVVKVLKTLPNNKYKYIYIADSMFAFVNLVGSVYVEEVTGRELFEGVDGRHLIHNIQDLKSAYLDPKDIKDPLDEPLHYPTYNNGVHIDIQKVNLHTVEEIDDNALLELNKAVPVEVCYDREKPSADYSDAFDILKSMLGG